MNETYISSIYKKGNNKSKFKNTNLIRIPLLILISVIYFLFVSPVLEGVLKDSMLQNIRESKKVTLNYLTPLYGQEMYTNEYNINTLATASALNNVKSNTSLKTEDPRVIAMQKFLLDYNSPLYPYSSTFITEADKYGLDWRLVASISGVESAFGSLIPGKTNNAWGWRGINKNSLGWSMFPTWDAGIAEVTRGMAQGYGIDTSPFEIEPYYCPPCGRNPAHTWANGVTRYMRELKYYLNNLK